MTDSPDPPRRPARVVIEGVPRVGFYFDMQAHDDSRARCPEDVPFCSCLLACLEFLGDGIGCRKTAQCSPRWQVGCGYAYLMGMTGAAFRLSWKPAWHADNCASRLVSDDPTGIFRRGFASVGYGFEMLSARELRQQGVDVEKRFRAAVIESVAGRGRPVIAHGVVGPPEECIITGYDEGGDVLIGWSFFQGWDECAAGLELEPSGYFRKRDWLGGTAGLLLIGDRHAPPDLREAYRGALEWALDVIRTPLRHGDRHNGLAAYDAWADHLLRDEDFATDDPAVLNERFRVHDDAVGLVAEGRWYASIFLAQAAFDAGLKAPELYAAASCCAAEHDLMWKLWGLVGGIGHGEEKARNLARGDVRRRMVPIIHEARDRDAEAADHIERALAK